MSGDWTVGRKLAATFAIAVVTQMVTSLVGYRSAKQLVENDRIVAHTHQVRRELSDFLSLMQDVETGQRGFLLTGRETYLEPYNRSREEIPGALDHLQELTSDNPAQQRRIAAIRGPVREKLEELAETIRVRREQGAETALALVLTDRGKRSMDDVRRIASEMDAEEDHLLTRRRHDAEETAAYTQAVILWGSIAGVVFVLVVAFFVARSLTTQLGGAAARIQSSSAELQAASTQQATGAREQATAMSEITTTISELLATSRQIADSAQRVAAIADQTSSASRAGETIVDRGHEAISATRRQVELIVHHMLELGKKSQQIGGVLDIVGELAEQTNILAINATIEAAGAGESGKRFAVVADEIRKLADRVGSSTKDVRTLIDEVRGAVNTTVMTTETGSKAVELGAKQFLEVATAFKQIAAQVVTTREAAKEIELSTKQQSTAVEQVNVAIMNVAQASKESETSTTQTLQTSTELNTLARELLRIVERQRS